MMKRNSLANRVENTKNKNQQTELCGEYSRSAAVIALSPLEVSGLTIENQTPSILNIIIAVP
jgi:hypothetical protein